MASDLQNLVARRSAILTELAACSLGSAAGGINSQAAGIDHAAYKRGLLEELRAINEVIAVVEGPWECVEEGRP